MICLKDILLTITKMEEKCSKVVRRTVSSVSKALKRSEILEKENVKLKSMLKQKKEMIMMTTTPAMMTTITPMMRTNFSMMDTAIFSSQESIHDDMSPIKHTFIPFLWHNVYSEEAKVFTEKNTWSEYKMGFARGKNLWFGLEKLNELTKSGNWYLIAKFKWWKKGWSSSERAKDDPLKGQYGVGVWPDFMVKNESDGYQWTFGDLLIGYNFHMNPPCDVLGMARNQKFSTKDVDNDRTDKRNNAERYGCGWWHNVLLQTGPTAPMYPNVLEGNVEEVATRCPGENDEVLVSASTTNLTLVQRNWPTGLKAFRISWTAVSRAERCDQLLCMTTGYCVHFSLRCNYVPNCGDGDSTDEQACEGASFLIGLSIGLAGIFVGLFALFYSNIRSKVEEFARSVEAEAQSPNSSEDVTVRTTASVRYNPSSHRLNLVRHNVAVGGGAQSHGAVPVDSGATIGSGSLPEVRTSLELVALRHTLELLPYNDATPPPYHSICHTYTQTGSTSGEGVLGEGAPREGVIPEVFGKAEAGPVVEDGDGKPDDMAARGSDCFGGGGGAGGGSSSGGVAAGIVDADRRDFVTPPPSYHEVVGSVETLDGDEWQSN